MSKRSILSPAEQAAVLAQLKAVLRAPLPVEDRRPILEAARLALSRREPLLRAALDPGTPSYVLSEGDLIDRARAFHQAFARVGARAEGFYAYKANDLPYLCGRLHQEGFGAEVVSGMELGLALKLGCERIVFNGPAKGDDELRLAVAHADRVWLHIDHEEELDRLLRLRLDPARPLRTAVRLDPGAGSGGAWRKFGVSPPRAVALIRRILAAPGLRWEGLHAHTSWNTSPEPYGDLLGLVSRVLAALSPAERGHLAYVDLGGGMYPRGEGNRLGDFAAGRLALIAEEQAGRRLVRRRAIYPALAEVDDYAAFLAQAWTRLLATPGVRPDASMRFEPGRWLVAGSVGILTTVVARKRRGAVLVDGGIHLTHDHRMAEEYHAIVNLSRPGKKLRERSCLVFGPMCDPGDLWGDSCWGELPEPGDRLLITNMGAYSSSSAMRFLFPLAPYVLLTHDHQIRPLTARESLDDRYPPGWFEPLTGAARSGR